MIRTFPDTLPAWAGAATTTLRPAHDTSGCGRTHAQGGNAPLTHAALKRPLTGLASRRADTGFTC